MRTKLAGIILLLAGILILIIRPFAMLAIFTNVSDEQIFTAIKVDTLIKYCGYGATALGLLFLIGSLLKSKKVAGRMG